MQKDFNSWSKIKEEAHYSKFCPPFKEREIWWCKFGVNVGDEQDGKGELFLRPVLIMRKFNKRVFIGLPLSSVVKSNNYFYHSFEFRGKKQSVIMSQIKLFDARRLEERMGTITDPDFLEIKNKAKELIFN